MYALVTGASAGIGMEIAKYLAVKGYDLILTARREDRLQKLRSQILNKYPDRDVIVIPADLSSREECMRLFKESCGKAGAENIDFVVNNAGMGVYGRFLETDLDKELTLIDLAIHEELRQAGSPVKVSCLCPGPVDTAFNDNSGVLVSGKQITARQAAREGVDGALKGKMIVIPGTKMKMVTIGSHLLGEHLSTRINYMIQKKKAGE